MEDEGNGRVNNNVAHLLLTDRLKEIWRNLMEEFQQSFDLDQLDSVLSQLRELDSTRQNPTKKQRLELMQKEASAENNNNDNSSSLEKKVFANHLLAKSVFKYLSHTDLLSCRLMNSYWNEFSTEIVLNRDYKITFSRKINRFYLSGSNWKSLDMFTEFLKRSNNFPCNKFVFFGGNLGNDDAQRFFSFYGPFIKSFEIVVDDYEFEKDTEKSEDGFSVSLTDSRVIGMILSQQLPNLEHLDLDLNLANSREIDWPGVKSLLFPPKEKVGLPNLKTVIYDKCEGDENFLRQLLSAAPNLKSFELRGELFDLYYLDIFIETGKIKSIRKVLFCAQDGFGDLVKLLEHGPEVNLLSLRDLKHVYKKPKLWLKILIVLTKFLFSSQKSLHTFDSFYRLGFLRQLRLPVLENVTELHLKVIRESAFNPQDIHDHSFSFLPRGATFSRNFPRLNSVTFLFNFKISNDNGDAASWWTKCFPIDEIVPSLKKIDICGTVTCPLLWLEKFSKMFPNVENLSIKNIQDFFMVSKIIWTHYTKLTHLKLDIEVSSSLNSLPFILDSSFTGIPLDTCKRLEKLSLFSLQQMRGNYRESPSIVNLQYLQTLDINLTINLDASERTTFLTRLSGPCAFNLLRNLRSVHIRVQNVKDKTVLSRIKNFLEPLTAYKVNIK